MEKFISTSNIKTDLDVFNKCDIVEENVKTGEVVQ